MMGQLCRILEKANYLGPVQSGFRAQVLDGDNTGYPLRLFYGILDRSNDPFLSYWTSQ